MRFAAFLLISVAGLLYCKAGHADDVTGRVRKAVERSTLDQPGTKPFHVKAKIGPIISSADADPDQTGTIEIWWASPEQWRREIRTPKFNQTKVVVNGRALEQVDSDYFPEWLREAATCVVRPVPMLDRVLSSIRNAEVRTVFGSTHISWVDMGSDGSVSKGIGAGISLAQDGTFHGGSGLGWSCYVDEVRDQPSFQDFHGRQIARKTEGKVVAEVTLLEDLNPVDVARFQTSPDGWNNPLETSVVDELEARKSLLSIAPTDWPSLEQGPLEGVSLASVVIDRQGKVHEINTVLSDNPGLNDAVRDRVKQMQFRPYRLNGQPVQVVTTITLPFKTIRPAGVESFASAREYFERGRKSGFLAAGDTKPYILTANFAIRDTSGGLAQGTYVDTWISNTQWRREATLGDSRSIRTRSGDKYYAVSDGPKGRLLERTFKWFEPIPALDTFVESDWRINRDLVGGVDTVRVASGYESPEGVPDPEHFRGFWFDGSGELIKSFADGFEVRRSQFVPYDGLGISRQVDVLRDGKLGLRFQVVAIQPAGSQENNLFVIKGHERTRQFTSEVR